MFAIWEFAQLPLYTIWEQQGVQASLWAALHCTIGDAIIAFLTFAGALAWATHARALNSVKGLAATVLLLGILATALIEVLSTQWLDRWAYGPLMPVEPLFGIGLSPLAQWIVVPAAALFFLRKRLARGMLVISPAAASDPP
jgi:hypothetical protein